MATLPEIETLTKKFSDAHQRSAQIVSDLNSAIEELQKNARVLFKRAYEVEAQRIAELHQAIEDSPQLFEKPRTVIFHGVKIGLQKGKGKIEIEKEQYEQVVKLIKKHFPDQTDILIITKEEPSKKAIANLSVAELKKLGLSVDEAGDQVVITPTDSTLDKAFKALLKSTISDLEHPA